MSDFEKRFEVWQRAHRFTMDIYKLTSGFPPEEAWSVASQLRRAASLIAVNTSEFCSYRINEETFERLCAGALFAGGEVGYLIFLIHDLGLITEDQGESTQQELSAIKEMIRAL